jgi:hypothetical protein
MDEVERFVSDENIANFVGCLRREHNPARLQTLKLLLIEEENRFGAIVERLRMVERYITDGAGLIVRQEDIIAKLDDNGRDTSEAQCTLQNLEMIQSLFVQLRARIYEEANRLRP